MAKRSYPSNDFFKHRDGPTRQARLNEWYMNKEGHSEADQLFKSSKDGVPNHPGNYQSFTPVPSKFAPEGQPYGDVVFRRNPYGDAEQIVAQDAPVAAKPTQHGMFFQGSAIDPKVDKPAFLETRGPGSDMSPPRGMNTGLGAMGSGPRRNEEMPESKA